MFKIKLSKIIGMFLLIIGIFVIFFPSIENRFYQDNAIHEKEVLANKIDNDTGYRNMARELYQHLDSLNKYFYSSSQEELKDPFSYEKESIDLSLYGINDNCLGYITIPKINVIIPIYLGASKENLSKGVGHLSNTSYPIGGINTNSVLAAHRGHSSLKLFSDIEKIEKGDFIYIQNFYEELTYQVFEIKVIDPDQIEALYIREGEDLITLITCHPKYIDNKRYLVIARRV